MGSTRASRLVQLDSDRRDALIGVGRAEHHRYVVTETHDTTPVSSPAPDWSDHDAALLSNPGILEAIRKDPAQLIDAPVETTVESAAADLACLALRQAGRWGKPGSRIEMPHQRFQEAVESAAAATDEQQAFEVALELLEGPEAARAFGVTP